MIRQATPKDIPYILELYHDGLAEMGETNIVEALLLSKIVSAFHLAPCFLLVKDGKVVGMMGLTVITSSHNGDASLIDYMFSIQKEYRNMRNLSAFIKEAKVFAKENNLPLKIESLASDDEEVRKRLFRMHGFRVLSVTGIYKELSDG